MKEKVMMLIGLLLLSILQVLIGVGGFILSVLFIFLSPFFSDDEFLAISQKLYENITNKKL